MQNRYVGDIGDFGKYGLLRALTRSDALSEVTLGVLWYLVPDEGASSDGSRVAYRAHQDCDFELYSVLQDLIQTGSRHVDEIAVRGVLPASTRFHDQLLSFRGLRYSQRVSFRREWLENAQRATEDCGLLFLDPDNGLEVPSVSRFASKDPKYVFYDDLDPMVKMAKSLIIYQHRNRTPLRRHVDSILDALHLRWAQISPIVLKHDTRLYFVLPNGAHAESMENAVADALLNSWGRVFSRIA